MAVSALDLEYGGGEAEAIAALLQDAVEDRGVTVEELRDRFGSEVAEIVEGCSDSFSPDPRARPPSLESKRAYLAHLAVAPPPARQPLRVRCVESSGRLRRLR